jgi:SpoVK/Ycf46/Vps4 family AAA+-type ATPase
MLGLFGRKKGKRYNTSSFTIKQDSDFYYEVKLHSSTVCFTKEKLHAETVVNELEKFETEGTLEHLIPGFTWQHIRDIPYLIDNISFDAYSMIRPVLERYGVAHKYNGNYIITLDPINSTVSYKTVTGNLVTGKHLYNGVAIREENGEYKLENVPTGKTITTMNNEEQLRRFYHETASFFPWHYENVMQVLDDNISLKIYFKEVKIAISSGEKIPQPNTETIAPAQFSIYGGTDPLKLEAYVKAMKKLNSFIGMKNVKLKIDEFLKTYSVNKFLGKMNIGTEDEKLHSLIVGPPGTGKTEVARIMSDLLWSLDMIEENKFVELSKDDLVKSAVGGTEEATKAVIEKALGGVMLIDEAYTLLGNNGAAGDNNLDYGKIALEIIMRAMSFYPGKKLVVIFAGYRDKIDELLLENDGLPSRFKFKFEFDDYTPQELKEIAVEMLESQGFVTNDINEQLSNLVYSKAKRGSLQGNARDISNLVGEITRQHKNYVSEKGGHYKIIHPEVIHSVSNTKKVKNTDALNALLNEAEKELNALIGLEKFKKQVRSLKNVLTADQKRYAQGIVTTPPLLHMAFKGNPGTGKTTAVRILAKILKGLGVLSSGHFIEVKGKDLVGDHEGHTPKKVGALIKKARGGILFIDEAYSIVNGRNDRYGMEALNTLLGEMNGSGEDADLAIIFAGYPQKIEELFSLNDGFKSRINKHFIFEDYNIEELFELFKLKMKELHYELDYNVLETAKAAISYAKDAHNLENSNARWIRNYSLAIKDAQADRLEIEGYDNLQLIKQEDVLEAYKMM